jgi:hypothetical protein
MRVTTSAAASVAARPTELKSAVTARPAANTRVAADIKRPIDSFLPGGGGCIPVPPHITLKPADAKVRATQGDQLHDIADGVRDGSVTAQESERLLKEQQKIADATRKAMADGKLSIGERLNLGMMQARADQNIEAAKGNLNRDFFAGNNKAAQRQADQIDTLADGRTSGNITNSEAGSLLGQQVEVSDARGDADTLGETLEVNSKLGEAEKDIKRHSEKGTQIDWETLPFPHPRPLPLPRPEFPRPLPLPFPKGGVIVG